MELTAGQLWSHVLEAAKERLAEQTYKTWLSGTEAVALTQDELLVEVPSEFHVQWVADRYGAQLAELVQRVIGREMLLTFQCAAQAPELPFPAVEVSQPVTGGVNQAPGGRPSPPAPHLNDRYTFERFVVGNNNQFAAAASHAVAANPARTYNPLFMYGGVGLGKTHLMHAIGGEILEEAPSTRIVYLTAEQFTNELVTAIQNGKTADFRRRYREVDLLLMDDVQFLAGKERTQEEFFHTFNTLYDARKQIILTSDRPPKEIGGLEARLVSRFEWGLLADIRAPDYETRMAILRKKSEDDRIVIDDDVIDFVARSCTSSVRQLEGAIIKLLAYSSLTNQEITVDFARESLKAQASVPARGHIISPEEIQNAVAEAWGVRAEALASKRRTKDLTVPRQVAMYLIRDLLDLALVQIGEVFGGRDHSTVIHSIRKVEGQMESDYEFRDRVEALRDELRRP
jgi:chromosomal replication initiator protein